MAHIHVQSLKKIPLPTPENIKEHNNKPQRRPKGRQPTSDDADPNVEGTRVEEQAEEAGSGGGKKLGGSGLQRSEGHRPPHARAQSTTRLETAL